MYSGNRFAAYGKFYDNTNSCRLYLVDKLYLLFHNEFITGYGGISLNVSHPLRTTNAPPHNTVLGFPIFAPLPIPAGVARLQTGENGRWVYEFGKWAGNLRFIILQKNNTQLHYEIYELPATLGYVAGSEVAQYVDIDEGYDKEEVDLNIFAEEEGIQTVELHDDEPTIYLWKTPTTGIKISGIPSSVSVTDINCEGTIFCPMEWMSMIPQYAEIKSAGGEAYITYDNFWYDLYLSDNSAQNLYYLNRYTVPETTQYEIFGWYDYWYVCQSNIL